MAFGCIPGDWVIAGLPLAAGPTGEGGLRHAVSNPRCPVVRDLAVFETEWIAHRGCVIAMEAHPRTMLRKRRGARAPRQAEERRALSHTLNECKRMFRTELIER